MTKEQQTTIQPGRLVKGPLLSHWIKPNIWTIYRTFDTDLCIVTNPRQRIAKKWLYIASLNDLELV